MPPTQKGSGCWRTRVLAGHGTVPAMDSLFSAAAKQLCEMPAEGMFGSSDMGTQLRFSNQGLSPEELDQFFEQALDATKKKEPIIESGNKYGVSNDFHKINGELLTLANTNTDRYKALRPADQERAKRFFEIMFGNSELRNRNPLHPGVLDSTVLGNLMNFPKHIFGMPFGSYATDGNESLSLVLYSYKQRKAVASPVVLFVTGEGSEAPPAHLEAVARRIGMKVVLIEHGELSDGDNHRSIAMGRLAANVAVVMSGFYSEHLDKVASWGATQGLPLHIHLLDHEWRRTFTQDAVHYDLPASVLSVSIEHGLFGCGYSLYRDHTIRDLHFDVGYAWQTAYLSPNEGGSGASTPLYVDFCFVMLGWAALCDVAKSGASASDGFKDESLSMAPTNVPATDASQLTNLASISAENRVEMVQRIATATMADTEVTRSMMEVQLVQFQQSFLGGCGLKLEACSTGGGTRSINLAFESVLARAEAHGAAPAGGFKVLTGNPHLAVERAERRFGFQLIRVADDGALCVHKLKEQISDPQVIAVYAQTLSYTDGITDPLKEIVAVLCEENKKRLSGGGSPVTLINDSCLAFSVLVHNDQQSMRVLDLVKSFPGIPMMVTLDAHKHLGTDKGVSTVIGTEGTLSHLHNKVRVGAQPGKGELVRALANLQLIGADGYRAMYLDLAAKIADACSLITKSGMTIVHERNRAVGTTVIAVEDPSGVMTVKLKKLRHSFAYLYNLAPQCPDRCQTGWSLSLTPNSLRLLQNGKSALDTFLEDLVSVHQKVKSSGGLVHSVFRESSIPGILLSGGMADTLVFQLLWQQGRKKAAGEMMVRRFFSSLLDSGIVCSHRRMNPLQSFLKRLALMVVAFVVLLVQRKRLSNMQFLSLGLGGMYIGKRILK